MKFLTSRCCKAVVAFVAAMSLSVNTFAASPQVVNSFYNYAKTNQISKIRRLQSMGYGIDVRTDDGISAYCLAKNDDNTQAMRLLERLGADKNQKCTTIAWGKTAAVALGVAAVGGGVALAAGGGGGGGGGDSDPCASKPNSQWFVDHCECVPGYEDPGDGICYKILTCGANQHQDKDKCVCNDGYIDQGGVCYVELTCGANAHQEGNECVCDGGYIEQGGVCYAELTCGANAHQEGNKCVCDGGYIEQGGVCYAELSCGAHGTQEGNTCKCEEGYKGSSCQECDIGYDRYGDDLCHKTLDCGQYGQQKGGTCVCYDNHVYDGTSCDNKCAEGYERQEDGSCLKVLDCGEHGESVGGQCVCKDGYAWDGTTCDNKCAGDYHMGDDGVCYAKLTCGNHGSQVNDQCVCETGYAWDGTTCDKQCDKDYIMGTDGVCYTDLKCGEHGKQVLDQCRCDAGYGRDASGACVEKNVVDKVGFEENANHNDGEVKIENNDFVDVYGMKSTFPAEDWVGSDSSLYNRHAKVDAGVTTGEWHSLIDITNNSDANVYGMYSELSGGIYNLYVNIEKDIKGEITAAINIKNHGNGNVYGIRGNNNVYNLYGDVGVDLELMKVSSSINVENDGSGTAYGMYGKTADNTGDYESAVITVKSIYDYMKDALSMSASGGDVYGLYATNIATNNGGRIDVSSVSGDAIGMSSNNTADNSGNITSTSVTGNATGMVGENVRHSGTMTVSSEKGSAYGISASGTGVTVKEKAQIDVSSKSQDNTDAAYGVYAKGGSVEIENGVQSIGITSEAGNAYGVYAINGTTITNAFGLETPEEGEANEPAKGIVVTSTSGEAYGLYGNSGNITNNGKVDVNGGKAAYGIKGEGGSITVTNSGSVLSHSDGGDAYGMHSENKASNSGTIEVSSVSGNAVGMVGAGVNNTGILNVSSTENNVYGLQWHEVLMSILNPGTNKGTINVSGNNDTYGYYASGAISASFVNETGGVIIGNNTSGNLYGVYAGNETSVNNPSHKNEGTIELTATTGNVYGMYGENVTLDNTSGEESSETNKGIVVTSTSGEAYGIYGKNSVITNSGKIAVNGGSAAYGIYADGGSVNNSGTITVDGNTAYGIYATNGATVTNTGTITLNGTLCDGDCYDRASNGNYIVLAEGSTLVNASLMSVAGDFDFDDYGSSFRMGKSGVVEASGEVSGTAAVDASVVQGGFEDEYREEGAIKGQNLGVAAASQSAMFEASIEEGEDGAADIVMKRESFNNLSSASSIAAYLEQNYKAEKNEQLFDALKSAPNAASYRSAEAELLGYGLLPNFSRENMTVLRSLNNALNKELFTAEGKERKMVGYDFLYQARDTKGTLTGYENYANTMYFMYDNEHENGLRSGLGMSITQFNSNYDDDSSRKEIMIQALVPVSYKAENGLKWASVARFGYGDGEYKRRTSSDVFESDLSEWIYGLSNAVRYEMDLSFVKVEPTAEFNVLGYYQNRIREDKNKANAIKADAVNNLSVEGGLGFNLSKEWKLNERDKLSVHAGAMYYHEFAEPYHSLDASIYGMTGSYRITDYEGIYDDDRGVLSAGFDYDIGDFTIYGQYNQYIEDENPMSINAGLKYRF